MSIASASRSSRSVVNTMSAASEEAVAPRAPIATPTRGRGQRGGVVDAVADHHGHRAFPLGAHGGDLVGRALVGVHLVQTQHGGDLPRRVRAVAGEHDQSVEPGGAQPSHRAGRVAAQRVPQQHRADELPVGADPGDRGGIEAGPVDDRTGPRGSTAPPSRLPTATRRPSTVAVTPRPGCSVTSAGNDSDRFRARASVTIASASTCGDS